MTNVGDVDPRVAATGGHRRVASDPKSNYEWPGMTRLPDWLLTRVHQHTRAYGCAKCGTSFRSPHAVYTHLAQIHPATGSRLTSGCLHPEEVRVGRNGQVKVTPTQIASTGPTPGRTWQLRLGEEIGA